MEDIGAAAVLRHITVTDMGCILLLVAARGEFSAIRPFAYAHFETQGCIQRIDGFSGVAVIEKGLSDVEIEDHTIFYRQCMSGWIHVLNSDGAVSVGQIGAESENENPIVRRFAKDYLLLLNAQVSFDAAILDQW